MLGGIAPQASPAAVKRQFAGTMLGMVAPEAPAAPAAAAPPARPNLASTMLGVSSGPQLGAAQPPQQAQQPARSFASTMIDVAPNPPPAPAAAPHAPVPPYAPAPPVVAPAPVAIGGQSAPAAKRSLASTVVGLAAPVAEGQPAQPRNRNLPKSTIMGVALPGIAPTRAPQPEPAPEAAPAFMPPPVAPSFVPPPPPEAPEIPSTPIRRASRAPAIALLLLAALGLVGAVVYVVFMRAKPPPAMSGELVDEAGAPQLVVTCDTCGAGSEIELGGKSAAFTSGKATVALDASDAGVGKHEYKGTVKIGSGKAQPITLQVLVPFAVQPSLAPLAKGIGEVDVELEVADEVTSVTVEGKPAKIAKGRAVAAIAIPAPEGDARSYEKVVEYAVAWKGGDRKGSVKLVVPYASLKVGLPGRRPIVVGAGELDVTGRATPNATVRLGAGDDAATVTADKDGAFKGRAKIAATDTKLEIRAFGAKAAPRTFVVTVAHAESAAAAEKGLRAEAKDSAAAVAAPASHIDEVVVVKADVVNVFEEDGRSGFRGDVRGKDAAEGGIGAPVRVLLPSGVTVQKGDVVEVIGVVSRAVPLAKEKSTIAEIDATFVVTKR
jgi:hypothetical protein